MDYCPKEPYDKFHNNIRGVIHVGTVADVKNEKFQGNAKKTKFHNLRKHIAVSSMTQKGLVELYKEGK
ncbi:hypothetical protein [Radiobacillus sp. PE A8.2]|uniref:hypothetical protein n=1 Tax=Radiobacillus sp. PE A8.2 TaxID=3380349 RepID=UPI00388E743D